MFQRSGVQESSPRVVKVPSFFIHSPLLSINFHHAHSSFLAPDIPLSFSAHFRHLIHSMCGLPPNPTPLVSNPIILFTNQFFAILYMCPDHLNILCSARPADSRNTSFSSHHLISHSVHSCYSAHCPQTPHLHYI